MKYKEGDVLSHILAENLLYVVRIKIPYYYYIDLSSNDISAYKSQIEPFEYYTKLLKSILNEDFSGNL